MNNEVIEQETLGRFLDLEPGEAVECVQYWGVMPKLNKPDTNEVYKDEFRPSMDRWVNRIQTRYEKANRIVFMGSDAIGIPLIQSLYQAEKKTGSCCGGVSA